MERIAGSAQSGSTDRRTAAYLFAREVHSGQSRRQGGRPFIDHPIAVADLLAGLRLGQDVLAAAYLHDVIEKTNTPLSRIEQRFGTAVATLVDALSEDEEIESYTERKRALRGKALKAGRDGALLFAADRLANLRDWNTLELGERRQIAERLGTTFEIRVQLWREDLADLNERYPELPFLTDIEVELQSVTAGSD